MPDQLFLPTHPSSPFSHACTRTHHQPDSSPPGLAQWACYIKASAYGSRVGWTPARRIHTYTFTTFLVLAYRGCPGKEADKPLSCLSILTRYPDPMCYDYVIMR